MAPSTPTWSDSPDGLATLLNHERFASEANSEGLTAVAADGVNGPSLALAGAGAAATATATLLPEHRIVAFYGNPRSAAMGVLGQLPPEQMLDQLEQQAQAYAALDSPDARAPSPGAGGRPGAASARR